MSRVRHRAPAARKVELKNALKSPAPPDYAYEPANRKQRRALAKALRAAGQSNRARRVTG